MPSLRLFRHLLAFVPFCLCNLPSGFAQEPYQIKFKVVVDMMIIPITINRAGPFDFLVDTGSTDTIIDRALAEELRLPPAGKMTIEMAAGELVMPLVQTDSLSIGGATVHGLNLGVVNNYANLVPKVRGILGENFLRSFDLLIDNRRHLIQLESGMASLAGRLTGERLPLSMTGMYETEPTRDRLVVVGRIHELGDKNVNLLLDSGTASIVLFKTLNTSTLVPGSSSSYYLGGLVGSSLVDPQTSRLLRLGDKVFRDLTVYVPRGKIPPMDVDGFLPITLFQSIFISHSGKYVILDPSAPKNPVHAQPKAHFAEGRGNLLCSQCGESQE